jgi:hypothetical protein
LVVGVVGVEVWGATAKGRGVLWDKECKRGQGEYSARCGKVKRGEVGNCVKDGVVVDVEEIARKAGEKDLERVGTV